MENCLYLFLFTFLVFAPSLSPEGRLLYQGAIDSIASTRQSDIAKAKNYVQAAYESAQADEPIADATTVPYGCGVKY